MFPIFFALQGVEAGRGRVLKEDTFPRGAWELDYLCKLCPKLCNDFAPWHRLGKVHALHEITAQILNIFKVCLRFNSLNNNI